jgi:hypothetical protein
VWIHLTVRGSIGTCENGSCNILLLFLKVRTLAVGRVSAFEENNPSHELMLRVLYSRFK